MTYVANYYKNPTCKGRYVVVSLRLLGFVCCTLDIK